MDIPLNTGEKLHLSVITKIQKKTVVMVSQVLECLGNNTFIIAMPMLGGKLISVQTNKEIRLAYYRDNGAYEFTATVLGRINGKVPCLKIEAKSPVYKKQRRNYYRLNTVLPVNLSVVQKEKVHSGVIKCLTIDISAGGMRLASQRNLEEGSILICELELMDRTLSIKAKVVRSTALYNGGYSYEIGIQFLGMDEKVRKEIIGYIFDEQRKLKRKGLI